MKKFFATLLMCLFVTTSAFAATRGMNDQSRTIRAICTQTLEQFCAKARAAKQVINQSYGYVVLSTTAAEKTSFVPASTRGIAVGIACNNKTGETIYVRLSPKSPLARKRLSNYTLIFAIDDRKAWEDFLAGKITNTTDSSAQYAYIGSTAYNAANMLRVARGVYVYQLGDNPDQYIDAALADMKLTQIQIR